MVGFIKITTLNTDTDNYIKNTNQIQTVSMHCTHLPQNYKPTPVQWIKKSRLL